MAFKLSVGHSCATCCTCKELRSLTICEGLGGYRNALGGRMRFNNLFLRISKSSSHSKHTLAERLFEELDKYEKTGKSDQSKLLRKVAVLVGYDGFHDFIENDRTEKCFGGNHKDSADTLDVSLACKRFPSIVLGSSPPVLLYDETSHCSDMISLLSANSYKAFLPNGVPATRVDTDHIFDNWSSEDSLSNVNSSSSEELQDEIPQIVRNTGKDAGTIKKENFNGVPLNSKDLNLGAEVKIDHETGIMDSAYELQTISEFDGAYLDMSIKDIPGIKRAQYRRLENCGFHTLRKLLNHFPRTYADLQNPKVGIADGQYLISVGEILSSRGVKASYSFSFVEVVVGCDIADNESQHMTDESGGRGKKTVYLHLKKYFRGARFASVSFLRCIQANYRVGQLVCVSGKVKTLPSEDHYEMKEYNIDLLNDRECSSLSVEGKPYPIYPSKGGLKPDFLRDIIARVVNGLPASIDPIPIEITEEFELVRLHDAYVGIHLPKSAEDADLARRRLIFDEFFYLQLARLFQMLEGLSTQMEKDKLLEKYRNPELNAVFMEEWSSLTKKFLKAVPYSLTPSQISAISEIIWDLKRPVPMSRLLQGDVGSGKTVVAFLACMEVIGSGYQAALMVPTELLAIQHYENLLNLLENMDEDESKPRVALLTGSTPLKESRIIRQDLRTGDISMVIGTHSLIAEGVEFSALRLAVVDEQHRFGVIQRGKFNSKLFYSSLQSKMEAGDVDGSSSNADAPMAPHVLAMSATPIPRTLALALYGDMSLTQITDLPPGRIPIETHVIETNLEGFDNVYKMMLAELGDGGKVYVVYPVIEKSEHLPQLHAAAADFEAFSQRFPMYKCGLLHGRMKIDEKDEALRQFRCGETQILLSTQVIEIGVDVPDASMMVVMNAERFGMAQLHQLRGRVGRGERKSKCILLTSTSSSLNRLKVLEESSDGFYLANMDLVQRGPGDLLGKKQSGHLPEFPIARLQIDGNILQQGHAAALKILSMSHGLENFPALKAELSMRQPLCILGD